MTDFELVAKKLGEIETYVRELRTLGRLDALEDDVREERFITHTLQLAIQATLDTASHIVADDRLGEPTEYGGLFAILARHGWISSEMVPNLRAMTGFRNILVHDYTGVDFEIVRDVVENRLDDLLAYVQAIRARAAAP